MRRATCCDATMTNVGARPGYSASRSSTGSAPRNRSILHLDEQLADRESDHETTSRELTRAEHHSGNNLNFVDAQGKSSMAGTSLRVLTVLRAPDSSSFAFPTATSDTSNVLVLAIATL